MKFTFTKPGFNCTGKTYTAEIIEKKFNGVFVEIGADRAFVCYSDIRIDEMTPEERAMPVCLIA